MPKGVYDRASSNWAPRRADDPPELVARIRELYESGLTISEVQAQCPGVKVQRVMIQHCIPRRPATPRDQRGEHNARWRGGAAGYPALHLRVESARGKPSDCKRCGTDEPATRYEWANLTGRYEDVDDYERMCQSCHRRYDAKRRRETGRRTVPPMFHR